MINAPEAGQMMSNEKSRAAHAIFRGPLRAPYSAGV